MLGELRRARWDRRDFEPTRVITVRLPKSLHESLRAEDHEKRTRRPVRVLRSTP